MPSSVDDASRPRCDTTDSWPVVQAPLASKKGAGVSSVSPLCNGHPEAGDLCPASHKQDAVPDAVVVAVALPVAAGGPPEAQHGMKQGRSVSAPGLADVDRYGGSELAADGPALRNISSHGGLEVSGGVPVAQGPAAHHPLLLQAQQQQQQQQGRKPPLAQALHQQPQQSQQPQQQQQHPAFMISRSLPAQWRSQSDPSHDHPNGVLSNSDDSDAEETNGGSGNGRRRHASSTRNLSLRQAVEMLNNPKLTDSAIERLHELHVLDASSPASIAATLHLYCRHNCLDATALGELLGGPSPRAQAVLAHFVSLIDVRGMSFVRAMRRVLCESGFRPPGEAQKIDRFVKVLAQHFVRSNRHCAEFPTDDLAVAEESAHLLAYALLQLNTAVHNPQARRSAPPMPVESFVAALRKPPLCTQRPELEAMYHSIAQHKLQMGEVVLESVAFKSKNRTLPDGMVVERLLRLYQSRFTTCRTYAGSSPAITTYELDAVGSSLTQVSSQSQQRELVPPQTNHWDANKRRGSFKTVQLFTFQVTCRKLVTVVPRLPGLLPAHSKTVRVELGWRTLEEASEWRSYFASRMGQGLPAPASAPSSKVSACGSLSPERSSSPPPPWPATPPQVASGRATPTSGRTSPPPE